jgi:hypothetical protein
VLIGARTAAELTDALGLRQRDLPAALWAALAAAAGVPWPNMNVEARHGSD